MKRLNKRGDTIVEVLIAIAIISVVLAGAYISANHTLNNSRQSQERNEAIKVAEGQLERLKGFASSGDQTIFTTPNTFCVDDTNAIVTATNPPAGSVPALDSDNFGSYQGACTGQGLGNLFNVVVERNGGNANQFSVFIRWDRAGGNARDEVKIVDRIYP
jgi:prepilin-type N-terminal cleavage/methylation domain-containing protein